MATPTVLYSKQFEDNIAVGLQQVVTFLKDKGQIRRGKGESVTFAYVDQESARKRSSRFADTIWDDPSANRVTCPMDYWEKALLLDPLDEVSIVADPKSTYVQVTLASLRRKIDELVITALRGNKLTGKTGGTSSALPSGRKIAAGSDGLTKAKLISALELLSAKGDGTMDNAEPIYFVATASQRSDLLGIAEVTSADYNTQRVLANGKIASFLGFTFIFVDEDLVPKSGSTRYCVAWKKSGLGIGLGQDITAKVDEVQQKGYAWGTYAKMFVGATRIEDEKVVEIGCVES